MTNTGTPAPKTTFYAARYADGSKTRTSPGTTNYLVGDYVSVENFIRFRLARAATAPGSYRIETRWPDGSYHFLTDAYKRV